MLEICIWDRPGFLKLLSGSCNFQIFFEIEASLINLLGARVWGKNIKGKAKNENPRFGRPEIWGPKNRHLDALIPRS